MADDWRSGLGWSPPAVRSAALASGSDYKLDTWPYVPPQPQPSANYQIPGQSQQFIGCPNGVPNHAQFQPPPYQNSHGPMHPAPAYNNDPSYGYPNYSYHHQYPYPPQPYPPIQPHPYPQPPPNHLQPQHPPYQQPQPPPNHLQPQHPPYQQPQPPPNHLQLQHPPYQQPQPPPNLQPQHPPYQQPQPPSSHYQPVTRHPSVPFPQQSYPDQRRRESLTRPQFHQRLSQNEAIVIDLAEDDSPTGPPASDSRVEVEDDDDFEVEEIDFSVNNASFSPPPPETVADPAVCEVPPTERELDASRKTSPAKAKPKESSHLPVNVPRSGLPLDKVLSDFSPTPKRVSANSGPEASRKGPASAGPLKRKRADFDKENGDDDLTGFLGRSNSRVSSRCYAKAKSARKEKDDDSSSASSSISGGKASKGISESGRERTRSVGEGKEVREGGQSSSSVSKESPSKPAQTNVRPPTSPKKSSVTSDRAVSNSNRKPIELSRSPEKSPLNKEKTKENIPATRAIERDDELSTNELIALLGDGESSGSSASKSSSARGNSARKDDSSSDSVRKPSVSRDTPTGLRKRVELSTSPGKSSTNRDKDTDKNTSARDTEKNEDEQAATTSLVREDNHNKSAKVNVIPPVDVKKSSPRKENTTSAKKPFERRTSPRKASAIIGKVIEKNTPESCSIENTNDAPAAEARARTVITPPSASVNSPSRAANSVPTSSKKSPVKGNKDSPKKPKSSSVGSEKTSLVTEDRSQSPTVSSSILIQSNPEELIESSESPDEAVVRDDKVIQANGLSTESPENTNQTEHVESLPSVSSPISIIDLAIAARQLSDLLRSQLSSHLQNPELGENRLEEQLPEPAAPSQGIENGNGEDVRSQLIVLESELLGSTSTSTDQESERQRRIEYQLINPVVVDMPPTTNHDSVRDNDEDDDDESRGFDLRIRTDIFEDDDDDEDDDDKLVVSEDK